MTESKEPVVESGAHTGLTVMSIAECVELLAKEPIGRVVFVDSEGQPIALPVNYCWYEDSVVFRTLEGQKLFAAIAEQRVSFEVDSWDRNTRTGTSVLVKGRAAKIDEWAEREQLERLDLAPWDQTKWHDLWVRIEPAEVTGRRIS